MPDSGGVNFNEILMQNSGLGTGSEQLSGMAEREKQDLQALKRSAAELERTYNQIGFAKHAQAVGALEMNRQILDMQKQMLQKEMSIARLKDDRRKALDHESAMMERNAVRGDARFQRLESIRTRLEAESWRSAREDNRGFEALDREVRRSQGAKAAFEMQFKQFGRGGRVQEVSEKLSKYGRMAMGANLALGSRDLMGLSYAMAEGAQYIQEGASKGGLRGTVGKMLASAAPWMARVAGPLALGYLGGELAKEAIAWYYEPKISAAKAQGDMGMEIVKIASDPNMSSSDFIFVRDKLKENNDLPHGEREIANRALATQMKAISAGKHAITVEDISDAEIVNELNPWKESGKVGGKGFWSGYWDNMVKHARSNFSFRSSEDIAAVERSEAVARLIVKRSEQRERSEREQKEAADRRMRDPALRTAKEKEDLSISMLRLNQAKSRMLAPTI